MHCILVENICAVSTKTSCYRCYFRYLFVYVAVLSGTSQVAELCRILWNVHPGVFVANDGHRAALTHLQWINKAATGSWINKLALLFRVSKTNHAPSDCCDLQRKNLCVSWNLVFGFKYFLMSFLCYYTTVVFLCIKLLDIITLVITLVRGWELFWLFFLVCDADSMCALVSKTSSCANFVCFPKWKISRRVQLHN